MPTRTCALALLWLAAPASLQGFAAPVLPSADAARRECERLNDAGSYAAALPHCRQAVAAWRAAAGGAPGEDSSALGKALTSVGLALEMTGDRAPAEASYREALLLHRAAGRSELEALVLSNLAALAIGGGDYGGALAWLAEEEAVAERAQAGGEADWAAAELDYVRMNRSVALEQLGAYTEALAEIRPLAAREAEESAGGAGAAESAALTVNLAVLYRNLGDPRRALVLLERAREAYERLGDRSALANLHLNRGLVYQLNLRAPDRAEAELEQALALSRESGDRGEEIRTLCALGDLRLAAGRLPEAQAAFTQALAAARTSDAAAGRWTAQAGLGRVARAAGETDEALIRLRAAIAEIESTGEGLGDSMLRGGLLADQRAVYAAAVDLLAERALAVQGGDGNGSDAAAIEALALAEQARARELLDALAGGGAASPLAATEIAALGRRLGPALVYFFGERHLWRWEHRAGRWQVAAAGESPGSPGGATALEIRRLVTQLHRRLARAEAAPPADLERLAALLLPATLPTGGELRIVPDGRLFYLPFELLPDPEHADALVVARRAVSYLPSLAVFAHLREPASAPRWRVAALADPELPARRAPGDASSLASLLAQRFDLPPLPGAAREARAAARRLGEPSSVDTGRAATEATLRRRAGEGESVLHLAAHTVVDEALAGGVALFLAPGAEGGAANDGLLTAPELAELKLAAELAVLSGCRTALAESSMSGGGDGAGGGRALASLSGALLGAGARGVVASLWEVGDEATAALMEQFYFELARGRHPAVALQQAKLRLGRDPRWAAAPGWAGFVLLGDPGPVAPASGAWMGVAAALAVLAGVALLLATSARRRRPPASA